MREIIKKPIFDISNFPVAADFIDAVLSGKYSVICYGGGVRGGKSFNGIAALTILHKMYPKSRSCIIRKDLEVLRINTLPTCEKAIPPHSIKKFNGSEYKWTFQNDSVMFFFAEGYEKDKELKRWNGLEVNFIMMDQVEELQFDAWEKAIERAGTYFLPSGYKQPKPIIILTVNPTQTWVKQVFYDPFIDGTLPDDWLYIPALVTDNPHADPYYLEQLELLKRTNPIKHRRMVEGDWDILDNVTGAFYKDFDYDKCVEPVYYEPSEPIHLSFDFNLNPYMTLTVYQLDFEDPDTVLEDRLPRKKINQIDEFCLTNPNNTTRAVCQAFADKYRDHVTGVFMYGDPAGKTEDTRSERGHNDYKVIKRELKRFRPKDRVEKAAPSIIMRGDFVNTIFRNQPEKGDTTGVGYLGLEIHIDEDCVKSTKDFTNVLEDAEGKKLKKNKIDPKTKVGSQELTHTSDSFEYFLCRVLRKEYAQHQRSDISSSGETFHIPKQSSKRF